MDATDNSVFSKRNVDRSNFLKSKQFEKKSFEFVPLKKDPENWPRVILAPHKFN